MARPSGEGRWRDIVLLEVYNGLYQSTLPFEIASPFQPIVAPP